MKVKKYCTQRKNEKKVDHIKHYKEDARGLRHAKRHDCQNYPNYVCREHSWNKHHICTKLNENQSPFFDYIVVAMNDSLDDQTYHANFFSSYRYEQQKMTENMMTQICETCTTW